MTLPEISTPSARSLLSELFGHNEASVFDQHGAAVMETYPDMFHRIYFFIECLEHELVDANPDFGELARDHPLNDSMKSPQKAMNQSYLGYMHRLILMKYRIRYEEPRKIQFSD
jgi:hypothetical protein